MARRCLFLHVLSLLFYFTELNTFDGALASLDSDVDAYMNYWSLLTLSRYHNRFLFHRFSSQPHRAHSHSSRVASVAPRRPVQNWFLTAEFLTSHRPHDATGRSSARCYRFSVRSHSLER